MRVESMSYDKRFWWVRVPAERYGRAVILTLPRADLPRGYATKRWIDASLGPLCYDGTHYTAEIEVHAPWEQQEE